MAPCHPNRPLATDPGDVAISAVTRIRRRLVLLGSFGGYEENSSAASSRKYGPIAAQVDRKA